MNTHRITCNNGDIADYRGKRTPVELFVYFTKPNGIYPIVIERLT